MIICVECGYPVSETVQLLMACGVRPRPGPEMDVCECGISHEELEVLESYGGSKALIELMVKEDFVDWWYMAYKGKLCLLTQ